MLNAVSVLPAGPEERADDALFPLRERIRFRDNLGLGLRDVRQRSVFATLARGPWLIFMTIACYWQSNAEAWPSQETIATFSGYSAQAVRVFVAVLEQLRIVRLRRERRPNGTERIYYAPGLVTLTELAAFVERFPRERVRSQRYHATSAELEPMTPVAASCPPETAAAAPPEKASMELRDQDQEPSSCEVQVDASPAERSACEEQQFEVSKEDEEIARRALAERMAKKHPTRSPPRWFDSVEVAVVAACAAAIEGDADAKVTAQRDAIAGAFLVSTEGAPTVRFIWGNLDHFFDHVERGRRRRLADERAVLLRATRTPARTVHRALARVPREQMSADLERLFGAAWKTRARTST
jgi:hypothetical protein